MLWIILDILLNCESSLHSLHLYAAISDTTTNISLSEVYSMSNIRFEIKDQLSGDLSLQLLYITSSRCEGNWLSYIHSHQTTELFYVVSGGGEFLVEDTRFPVRPNDVVIINPHVQHTETCPDSNPLEYIVLGIEGGEFLLKDSTDTRYCMFNCYSEGPEVQKNMRSILRELDEKREHHNIVARNLLENLAVKLLRHRSVSLTPKPPSKKSRRECCRVKNYIDHHFKEHISLDMLSEVAHVNKYHLVHSFTQEMGISPINYLIQQRIAESKHMLEHTEYSISEISQILAFSSPSYFSQSFSRLNHMSPREYRAKHHANRGQIASNFLLDKYVTAW